MADFQIALQNIQNIKTVDIEGVGLFRVRKLGAGEELDLSSKLRRLMEIAKKLEALKIDEIDATTKEGQERFAQVSEKVDKYSAEIGEIKKFELETYKKCFVDENNGENVDFLINALSDEERTKLFDMIFNVKPVENKDIVEAQNG